MKTLSSLGQKTKRGLTLIEVTLVIAVLLSMTTILFVGVSAFKKGAERADCILNIATVQKAARSYQNLYGLQTGTTMAVGDIAGTGKFLESTPACPTPSGAYTFGTAVPGPGVAFVDCSLAGSDQHLPTSLSGW